MDTHLNDNPWRTLASQTVYSNPYFTVREDAVITPGGKQGTYSVIQSKPGVLLLVRTTADELYLIQSFRYPQQAWRWEVPGGGIDKGSTPLEAAKQELEQELGLRATQWEQLGDVYPSNNGPMEDHNYVFLAQELQEVERELETGEAIRPPQAMPYQAILAMVQRGDLTDGQSLGALLYYSLWRSQHVNAFPKT